MPHGMWPAMILDPYITLLDVPALPDTLPHSQVMYGRPLWHLRHRDGNRNVVDAFGDGSTAFNYGRRIDFNLRKDYPISCDIGPRPASYFLEAGPKMSGSLGVLTICWSYIISVRFLEMQGRGVQYTKHRLEPQRSCHYERCAIILGNASPALTRWLCAILCPELGWRAEGKGFPPWAAHVGDKPGFSISAQVSDMHILKPPTSKEATYLLLELCNIFGLGTVEDHRDAKWASIPPYKAAFMASLMLPFYGFMGLRPQFSHPHLTPVEDAMLHDDDKTIIHQYIHDLPYFMTLSLHPPTLGAVLWSIFWQPDVECNLVTPWLAGVLDALGPNIDESRLEILLKVFAARRPRAAFWWLALFLLGDLSIMGWIRRYIRTMREMCGSGSLSLPDPMVTAWTGSMQSFLDFEKSTCYTELSDSISRADLLRCRYDYKLQDSLYQAVSWRPFGHLAKKDVEPELWPRLETDYVRLYHSFTWYRKKLPIPANGFRANTKRNVENVPDAFKLRISGDRCPLVCQHQMMLAPSKRSTMAMLSLLVADARGGRHWTNTAMPHDFRRHPWTREWEGVDSIDMLDKEPQDDDNSTAKAPSWFLMEWIEGEHSPRDN